MESKKVLIVAALGGFVKSFLQNDILLLQNMGYEVFCCANLNHPGSENLNEYFKKNHIHFIQVDFSSQKVISIKTIKAYRQIKAVLKKNQFKLIHVHTPIAGFIVRWANRNYFKKGQKIIYTSHGFSFCDGSSKKSWIIFYNLEKFISKYTTLIITINKEDYNNALSFKTCHIEYVPGVGVNTNKFINTMINEDEYRRKMRIPEDNVVILSIGELSKRKNHIIVLHALHDLEITNVTYVICGIQMNDDGTYDLLRDYAIENNIDLRLLGLRKDIPELCKCSNFGIIPSLREGLGLAGIEMLSSGLPVLGAKVQGIKDYILEGTNGYLFNPNNEEELSELIAKMMINYKEMKFNSAKVAEFDIKNVSNIMASIYSGILKMRYK